MGIPQVPDQVRKAPTLALRSVFGGIGKILMAADRPGSRPGGPRHAAPPGRRTPRPAPAPAPQAASEAAAEGAEDSQRWRSLDETGNVRLLSAEDLDGSHGAVLTAEPHAARVRGASARVQAAPGAASRVQPQPAPPGPVVARGAGSGLSAAASQPLGGNVPVGSDLIIHAVPLPGYDTMSVASIRSRMRSLDFDQLQALLVHERKNAQRPEVIAMIERRIQKLEAGG